MNKTGYDFSRAEKRWQKFWQTERIYQFDPDSKKPLFTIDTPPPTVSGPLHLGSVFSYSQAEIVVRFLRMAGYNVRYPIGWDNNGLATEKLVEKEKGVRGRDLSLSAFSKICHQVIAKYQKEFETLWKLLGFSLDWRLTYSTISLQVQKMAQTVFKQLYNKGLIYQKDSPALYCPECTTSVAQAEVEDSQKESVFYDISFTQKNGKDLVIATTRPELIPACVAVFVNPKDKKYRNLIGQQVKTPFGDKIKILKDKKVQMEKGTGAVMCCTYGDETDVYWVKAYNLEEKIILDKAGKFTKVDKLPELEGKTIFDARKFIVEKLREMGKVREERPIVHDVGVHERCGTPIEIINTSQWFIKILDKKDRLLKMGDKIDWFPAYMKKRYVDWIENLKWDWSISRERFFGIPIPVYHCQKCGQIIIPPSSEFPVDPRIKKYVGKCPKCGADKIIGETKVLDTWFTSALTPDINSYHPQNGKLTGKMYPASMRPHAHEIIRTWDVYTIVMGLFRHNEIPWQNLMISGHILVKKGEKISKKTGGGAYDPVNLIATHSADVIRYAMCSASLGQDSYFDEGELKMGKKLVTKIYNAVKFALFHLSDFEPKNSIDKKQLEATDVWILGRLEQVGQKMKKEFQNYEISKARLIFEDFFWNDFCNNYLEIVKNRLYDGEGVKKKSAQFGLYHTTLAILKMAAPFVPHITEEMYHANNYFSKKVGVKSIHLTSWPEPVIDSKNKEILEGAKLMLAIISQIRKYKSDRKMSLGTKLENFAIAATESKQKLLEPFLEDIKGVTRTVKITLFDGKIRESERQKLVVKI